MTSADYQDILVLSFAFSITIKPNSTLPASLTSNNIHIKHNEISDWPSKFRTMLQSNNSITNNLHSFFQKMHLKSGEQLYCKEMQTNLSLILLLLLDCWCWLNNTDKTLKNYASQKYWFEAKISHYWKRLIHPNFRLIGINYKLGFKHPKSAQENNNKERRETWFK